MRNAWQKELVPVRPNPMPQHFGNNAPSAPI
jgi:hypothetical protein